MVLLALAVGALVFGAQWIYWRFAIHDAYFPSGDDFALLVHSTVPFHPHPAEWITRGFADYFQPYPDFSTPYSNFLRPCDNLALYLGSFFFGRHWSAYLLGSYLIAASLCAVVFALAAGPLRLSRGLSALATLAAVTSPAYTYHVVYRTSFAFDYLGALWSLCALLCLLYRRFALAWLCVALAVASKETAFYVAPASFFAVLVLERERRTAGRRWLQAGSFLLPLVGLLLLRRLAFHGVTGVYILQELTPRTLLRNLILGGTQWPYMLPGEQHIFALSAHNGASLLLSGALWLLIGAALLRVWRSPSLVSGEEGSRQAFGIVFLFLLWGVLLPLALNLGVRFGASVFPLLVLFLASHASAASEPTVWRWRQPLALAALSVCIALDTAALGSVYSPLQQAEQRRQWALSRNFVAQLGADTHPVQFLVGDTSEALTSPESIERFAGLSGHIVPVLTQSGARCSQPPPTLTSNRRSGAILIHATLQPGCGDWNLATAYRAVGVPGTVVQRNLREAELLYNSPNPTSNPGEYSWQTVSITLQPKVGSYAILAPDLRTSTYRVLALEGP